MQNNSLFYSGLVWLAAVVGLGIYALLGTLGYQVPGVEQLVAWLSELDGWWILLAAFLAILIEGLYFFGSFLPGSTLVVVVAILAQLQSWWMFGLTILTIFVGWVLAGAINILLAKSFTTLWPNTDPNQIEVKDDPALTWFPAFRANTEVAQIIAGASARQVFWSSVRVKVWGSLGATVYVLVLPLLIDISELENEEGFIGMFVVAVIMASVGAVQLHTAKHVPAEVVDEASEGE